MWNRDKTDAMEKRLRDIRMSLMLSLDADLWYALYLSVSMFHGAHT